jgi:predicted amidophosphoribosyltransferase
MIENCTEYVEDDWPDDRHVTPCKCPVCSGFLKWDDNGEPVCNKCGAELVKVPEVDEETKEVTSWGKICAISGRKKPNVRKPKKDPYVYSI